MRIALHPKRSDVVVVEADESINHEVPAGFTDTFLDLLEGGARWLIVDCAELTLLSSAGLGVLLTWNTQLDEYNGETRLARASDSVRDVLRMTTLDNVFPVHQDIAEAASAFPRD